MSVTDYEKTSCVRCGCTFWHPVKPQTGYSILVHSDGLNVYRHEQTHHLFVVAEREGKPARMFAYCDDIKTPFAPDNDESKVTTMAMFLIKEIPALRDFINSQENEPDKKGGITSII